MYQQFSFMLALLLVIIAGVTVLIMLEMGTTPSQKRERKGGCSALHRLLGYVFLMLFAVLLAWMVFRAGSFQEDMPAPVMILALLLVPLIMIKVVVARQKALVSTRLILLGLAIFGLSFGLTGMAAYYYGKQRGVARQMPGGGGLSMEPGQSVVSRKCSKCHTLERLYNPNIADWTPTVKKMAAFDTADISGSDEEVIISYLTQQSKRLQVQKQRGEAEQGRRLVAAKCSVCHGLDKVFMAVDKDEKDWRQTVKDMIKLEGNQDYLSNEEKELVIKFLSSRQVIRAGDGNPSGNAGNELNGVRRLAARKCSAGCHALERVLRTKKTREAWTETINSMIEITGDPGYLSAEEKEELINFLSLPPEQRGKEPEKETAPVQSNSATADTSLIKDKCSRCHGLERIYQAAKSKKAKKEWEETVIRMAEASGQPDYLTEQEKNEIVNIIRSWEIVK
ncbi:hypothetical protein [Candidatus Electronema sp. JM]|uniref:hypothetical protein n=1 Tax=Candidatus Electronema sp. JM TaxID=3401571 RepID=UPI003AA9346B